MKIDSLRNLAAKTMASDVVVTTVLGEMAIEEIAMFAEISLGAKEADEIRSKWVDRIRSSIAEKAKGYR